MLYNIFSLQLLLLLTLSTFSSLHAASYDEDIIKIYSKMTPRFIIMSSLKDKIDTNIEICILRDNLDLRVAASLSEQMNSYYPNGLLQHPITLIESDYDNLELCKNAQLLFMFNSQIKNIKKAIDFSKENAILTIAYDISSLDEGADISLFIGRKVMPYINMASVISKKILLDNILIRVSKIYTQRIE